MTKKAPRMAVIGDVRSVFREKFGIPRQPGLAPAARAEVVMRPDYAIPEAFESLDSFSHIWLVFLFHAVPDGQWKPRVRPPRMGGNRRVGVFATRSGFRPNRIGLSAVRLEGMVRRPGDVRLKISGADLLDGTPVLDVKPYIPWADAHPEADAGWAATPPGATAPVSFLPAARRALDGAEQSGHPGLEELVVQVLSLDPGPAYHDRSDRQRLYGMRLGDFDLRWRYRPGGIEVVELLSETRVLPSGEPNP